MNEQTTTDSPKGYSPTLQDDAKGPEDHNTTDEGTPAEETPAANAPAHNQQDQNGQNNSPAPHPNQEDFRIVISRTENRSIIGVHRTDTDPYIEIHHQDDVDLLLETARTTYRSALQKWESQPRNPKHSPPPKTKQRKNQRNAPKGAAPPAEPDQSGTNEVVIPENTPVNDETNQPEVNELVTPEETPVNDETDQPEVNELVTPEDTLVNDETDHIEANDPVTQQETPSNDQPETPEVNQPAQGAFSLF